MFEQLKPLLLFILPASVICTVVGLWAWRKTPGRKEVTAGAALDSPARDLNLPLALLVPVLVIAGWSITLQPFAWKPHSTIEWMPYVIAAGGVVAVVQSLRAPATLVWLLRVVAVGIALWLLSKSSIQNRWTTREAATWVGAGVVGTLLVWVALSRSAKERSGAPSLLFVVGGALSSVMMLMTGEIKMPMLFAGLCACVGPGLIVAIRRPSFALGSLAALPALGVGAIWFYVITLGDTPWWCAVLGVLGMVLIPISALGALSRLVGWKRWLVGCVLVALPGLVGLGILIAQRASQPAPAW